MAGGCSRCLPRAPVLDHPLFQIYGSNFHAYRGFMLHDLALMFVALAPADPHPHRLVIQAAPHAPEMVGALGHNVPRVHDRVRGRLHPRRLAG